MQRSNFLNVQVDAIGVGLANSASPFLPVFLTRLGASNAQVGLLTAMPGITGLFMALIIGRVLQGQRRIVPWFSVGRLLLISAYAATGLVTLVVPAQYAVAAVLGIWALASIPQVIVNITWSLVMNGVAGPEHRYDLMTRRWTLMGITMSVTVAAVGQVLNALDFPINYQLVFMALSLGGLVSYYYSSHIRLPDVQPPRPEPGSGIGSQTRSYLALIAGQKPFLTFVTNRFVYMFGSALAIPLFPLYFVRVLDANDAWIGVINTAQTTVMLVGYTFWARQSRLRGPRFVLLGTIFGAFLYPALTAVTPRIELVVLYAGLSGLFLAGLELVFFDELMKTVPPEHGAIFVSFAQVLQHAATVAAPLIGTWLADSIGLSGALLVSAGIRLVSFGMFARR